MSQYVVDDSPDYLGSSKVGRGSVETGAGDVAEAAGVSDDDRVVAIESNEGVVVLPESHPVDSDGVLGTYRTRQTHATTRFRLGKAVLRALGVEDGDRVRFYERETGVLVTGGGARC